MRKSFKVAVVSAALTLCLGLVPAASANSLADPQQEYYSQHVLPYYSIKAPWLSILVLSDTSFSKGANVLGYFYDQACNLVRDIYVPLTKNDVELVILNDAAYQGIPEEGVIYTDSVGGKGWKGDSRFNPFLAYVLLFNTQDNRLIRIDSIPFDPSNQVWLRYDAYNTAAATWSDKSLFDTTVTFFNARGDLRTQLDRSGRPISGDWVNKGRIGLFAYDDDENFLISLYIPLRCFERYRLADLIPQLGGSKGAPTIGHVLTVSLQDEKTYKRHDFSAFQETVLGDGTKFTATGYFHHSGDSSQRKQLTPLAVE